ncbi:MAG: hypothetical protein AAF170_17990 [Bacteroidota bacterium]
MLDYGRALAEAGRQREAERWIADTVERLEEHHPNHYLHGEALVALATIRDPSESDGLIRRGLDVLERALPEGHWRIEAARQRVVR